MAEISTEPSDAQLGRDLDFKIETVETNNDRSAIVRVRTCVQGTWYTDHLLLGRMADRWLILAKLFDPDLDLAG